ncbi:hypothetical protein B9T26_11175 [Acinetobacter sp. ANC 4169]|uniref:DUF4303 domain-containing protein n=1 Tax=Acinetobacter sp. ANC 4169 TaxID=1977879 RepID=UPI000A355A5D|nr:DUF4303 domain-containing protein [Acinetobacter sp. ANC 4169]OTG71943.1 hypothetical protein B9T26_11175 [Acinetobacter sp. ANC 4169]
MLEHIQLLQDALIEEFYSLYDQYNEDHIYACALVFNEYLLVDYLAISTTRSLFAEHEETVQYLSEQDKWAVKKWRYRSPPSTESRFAQFKSLLADYLKTTHIFGNPVLEQEQANGQNNLDLFITAFKQAQQALAHSYGLDINNIVFFISIPNRPQAVVHSAQSLNVDSLLLAELIQHHAPQNLPAKTRTKQKLSQADKDLLVDVAQMVEVEPYDYLQVAQEAYLLTLESTFIDTNPYIQKLIQTIAAMDSGLNDGCALEKQEILDRIEQFYHANHSLPLPPPPSLSRYTVKKKVSS